MGGDSSHETAAWPHRHTHRISIRASCERREPLGSMLPFCCDYYQSLCLIYVRRASGRKSEGERTGASQETSKVTIWFTGADWLAGELMHGLLLLTQPNNKRVMLTAGDPSRNASGAHWPFLWAYHMFSDERVNLLILTAHNLDASELVQTQFF